MDPLKNSETPKHEELGETKSSLSAELFCDQVLGEPSVSSQGGGDFGLEFVGIPGDLLVGVTDSRGNDSIFANVEDLLVEQNIENGGGPRVEELPAVEESAGLVQMQEEESAGLVQMQNLENGGGPRVEELPAVEESAGLMQIQDEESAGLVQMQEEEKGNADLELNEEVDSPGKIDVSSDGISLTVEFFGPPNGISEDPSRGEELEGSGQLSKNNVPQPGEKDTVGKEMTFLAGAVVWAKTKKSQLWWPGVICSPIDPSRKDSFLVQHLASANVVWHSSAHLMHFLEGFDQFCHQQDSRSFHAAVERAIFEIGERVKTQMTCPCFSRDGEKSSSQLADGTVQRYAWSEDKHGVSCASSKVQFHPARFLAMIKYLAQNTPATDKIMLISTQSCLMAIYRSLGHHQLPIQQFAPDAVKHTPRGGSKLHKKVEGQEELLVSQGSPEIAENDLSGGESSRRRRKSKYLSYPFIDPKKKDSGENISAPDPQVDQSKSSEGDKSKKSKKVVSAKSGLLNLSGKFKDISSSSANILSDLHCQAIGCLPPKRRSYADSVCRFLCGFRTFRFLKPEIAKEHVYNHDEDGTPISPTAAQEGSNEASGVAVTPTNGVPKRTPPADGTPKKSRKRKEDKTSSGTMPSGGSPKTSNSKEVGETGSATQKSEKVSHKRKKVVADSGLHVSSPLPPPPGFGLPDLNGNLPAPAPASAEVNQASGSTVLGLPCYTQTADGLPNPGRSNSFRFVQLLKDVQTMGPNFLQFMAQTNHIKAEPQTTAQAAPTMLSFDSTAPQQANGSNPQVGSATNNTQPLSPGSTGEKKKRKRKPKTLDSQNTAVPTPVPDLNGTASVPDLNGTVPVPDLNGTVVDGVPAEGMAPGIQSSSSRKAKLPIKRRNMAAPVNAPPGPLLPHPLMSPPAVPSSAPPPPPLPPLMPLPPIPAPVGPGGQSNLLAMQQNLKMMTSMLEKAGTGLSLEKRTLLETEINGLMKKISNMVGSSSSA